MHTADYTVIESDADGKMQALRFWAGFTANHYATIVGYRFTTEDGVTEPGGLSLVFGQRNTSKVGVSLDITPEEMHELADVISEGRARLTQLTVRYPESM